VKVRHFSEAQLITLAVDNIHVSNGHYQTPMSLFGIGLQEARTSRSSRIEPCTVEKVASGPGL
jgi:hypothetical protein